jgi:putative DNA primase/helicase
MAVSKERRVRQKLTAEFGHLDNYNTRKDLIRRDEGLVSKLRASVQARPAWGTEALEALERLPFWADAFELKGLPLGALGAPELSEEWDELSSKRDVRASLGMRTYQDYTELGWPKSAGKAVRYVTPQEHEEIMSRLNEGGLTLPGSEVPLVGHTMQQLFRDNQTGPGWLIDALLREGGSALVYGPPGVGKTWFVHTLVWLTASGKEAAIVKEEDGEALLKAGAHEELKVLVLDGEMTKADLKFRGKQIAEMLGQTPEEQEKVAENVHLYLKTEQDHRAWFPDVVDPEWRVRIIEHCQKEGFGLVVFDNLTTLSPSLEDENSATAWAPLNDLVVGLKKAGVATLVVHHSNRSGTGYRGSSAILTTMETVVGLEALAHEHPERTKGAGFKVTVTKDRANGTPKAHDKTLLLREGSWRVHVDVFDNVQRVYEAVKSLRFATQQEIADALGLGGQGTVSKVFDAIVAKKLVKSRDELREYLRQAKDLRMELEEAKVEPEWEALVI